MVLYGRILRHLLIVAPVFSNGTLTCVLMYHRFSVTHPDPAKLLSPNAKAMLLSEIGCNSLPGSV